MKWTMMEVEEKLKDDGRCRGSAVPRDGGGKRGVKKEE